MNNIQEKSKNPATLIGYIPHGVIGFAIPIYRDDQYFYCHKLDDTFNIEYFDQYGLIELIDKIKHFVSIDEKYQTTYVIGDYGVVVFDMLDKNYIIGSSPSVILQIEEIVKEKSLHNILKEIKDLKSILKL